jgi:hypothetical protein
MIYIGGKIMKTKYSVLGLMCLALVSNAYADVDDQGSTEMAAEPPAKVCLTIDTQGTESPDFRNQAWNVKDPGDFFYVDPGKVSCFELSKAYYMSYFLYRTSNTIVYGTICRYQPKIEDSGKTLRFIGNSGGSVCPIE